MIVQYMYTRRFRTNSFGVGKLGAAAQSGPIGTVGRDKLIKESVLHQENQKIF